MGQDHQAEVRHHHVGEDLRVGMPFYHQKGQEDGGKRGSKGQIDRTTNTSSCMLLELETISLGELGERNARLAPSCLLSIISALLLGPEKAATECFTSYLIVILLNALHGLPADGSLSRI